MGKSIKSIKNIVFLLAIVFVALNVYLYFDAKNYVKLFSESFLYSIESKGFNKNIKYSEFNIQDNELSVHIGEKPELSDSDFASLIDNEKFFDSIKLDRNLYAIKYYELKDNGSYVGFSGEFILTESRLYQIYVPIILNICFFILIYILYKQKLESEVQFQKILNTYHKKIEKLEQEANIDPVTLLKNQHSLEKTLSLMKSPKLLLIDIDEFIKINDYFDVITAENLIKHIALVLNDFAKENGLQIFRLYGGLIALVEDSTEDEQRYEELLFDLLHELKSKDFVIEYNSKIISIILTITVGICLEEHNTLKKAYIALKRAKRDNKLFVSYSKFLDEENKYFLQLVNAKSIQSAIAKEEIFPFFQPIFDRNRNITKYESLVRIVKKTENGTEVISPNAFLSLSIKIKQYELIESFVIEKVISMLQQHKNLVLTVNLSARDMIDSAKNDKFINLLRKTGVANRLVIEIVEDENISENEKILKFLKRVKELGGLIAIDDFGSGFSNFAYLLEIMPNYIKIDGSIIENVIEDEKSQIIVKTIVLFAHSLGIKTVAEFVSTEEIFNKCIELGIDEFQGFYLGKPSPSFHPEDVDLDFYKLKEKNA